MKIIVSGGTGFLGRSLVKKLLEEGHRVILLVHRTPPDKNFSHPGLKTETWDGKTAGPWIRELDGADAVINLAGISVADNRWTRSQKIRILRSRLQPTQTLVHAITGAVKKPGLLINASAGGYYGHVESGDVTEARAKGTGFLPGVCHEWEFEALKAKECGVRVVLLRTGIVLEKDGGILAKMVPAFRLFLGGPLGSGKQWIPWIHREDAVRAIAFLLNSPLAGPVNITAPEPASMSVWAQTLASTLKRPCGFKIPGFLLHFLFGERSVLFLTGQRAVPAKLLQAGFQFRHPHLEEALASILPA